VLAANPEAIAVTLDKIDLIDRKFSQSLLGYRRDEVDRLVAEAADAIGRLAEEKMALSRTVESLRREITEYQSREAVLRDRLLTTQQTVEDLKAEARQEAERILGEARGKATAMVREAEDQVVALGEELDALKERRASLVTRFREMLTFSLDLLEAEAACDIPDSNGSGAPIELAVPDGEEGEGAGGAEDFLFSEMPETAPDSEK